MRPRVGREIFRTIALPGGNLENCHTEEIFGKLLEGEPLSFSWLTATEYNFPFAFVDSLVYSILNLVKNTRISCRSITSSQFFFNRFLCILLSLAAISHRGRKEERERDIVLIFSHAVDSKCADFYWLSLSCSTLQLSLILRSIKMFPSKETVSCFYCEWTGRKDKLVSHSNKYHSGAKVQIGIAPNAYSTFWKQQPVPLSTDETEKSTNAHGENEDSLTFDQTQSTTMSSHPTPVAMSSHTTPVAMSSHTTPVTTPTMPSPF